MYSVLFYNLGMLETLFGGINPPKPFRGDGTVQVLFDIVMKGYF